MLASYRDNWEVRWGDGDVAGTEGWQPLDAAALSRFAQYKGVVWLRKDMPKLLTNDPHVMLLYGRSFEAYENGRLLLSYNMLQPDPYVNHYIPARIVKLSQGDQPRTLAFKLLWNRNSLPKDWNVVGDRRMLDRLIVQNDFLPAVFSVLLTTASAVSLLVFLRRRSETLYAWFALITGCAGIGFFSMLMSLRFFFGSASRALSVFQGFAHSDRRARLRLLLREGAARLVRPAVQGAGSLRVALYDVRGLLVFHR
ncbi:hypothetical protein [Cohnella rhizosphaerae]|uniref:Uncharacterized protein n=1 Tax=Cohnella rhizosphaerae TaxID=1457232 RepID=A0A9X4L0X4_9BACL|nr:hypothetical protein [Cohnella rhizosphaerae]MDG0814193.1 hypothetical protein [Cohnella rhizosphaerae]